mgnify:CR=1 FL=1
MFINYRGLLVGANIKKIVSYYKRKTGNYKRETGNNLSIPVIIYRPFIHR